MLAAISRTIDSINCWVAGIAKWLIAGLVLINCYEVFMRHAFNRPSIWAYDMSYMLGGTFFVLGVGYALLTKTHVRVDVLYVNWSARKQAIWNILFSILLFFPTFGLLFYKLIPWVIRSWERQERASGSFWLPPIYPLKTIILIAVFLLLLQGVSELCKDIQKLKGKQEETSE